VSFEELAHVLVVFKLGVNRRFGLRGSAIRLPGVYGRLPAEAKRFRLWPQGYGRREKRSHESLRAKNGQRMFKRINETGDFGPSAKCLDHEGAKVAKRPKAGSTKHAERSLRASCLRLFRGLVIQRLRITGTPRESGHDCG
jgi:hypothetical protein